MNKEKITWGLILLFTGVVLLLSNLRVIDFHWGAVIRLWPVLLIAAGVNLVVPRHRTGNMISVVTTVLALLFLTWQGMSPPGVAAGRVSGSKHVGQPEAVVYSHPYDDDMEAAYLSIRGGAADYKIQGYTDDLVHAETHTNLGSYLLKTKRPNNREAHVSFTMGKPDHRWQDMDENRALIRLNASPVWHISLDMGAGAAEFDLSPFRLATLNLKGGALSFEAKLGMPQQETVVNVDSGVASVEIAVPKAAACRIEANTGLSSKSFPGFTQQPDGSYTTEGWELAAKKIIIRLKGGLSSFVVKQYE